MYEEGLAWEQPWLPRVEMVEVKDRGEMDAPGTDADLGDLSALGVTVRKG